MRPLWLFVLALAVVVTEAHSETAFVGSSVLDQSAELPPQVPRHRLDFGVPTRKQHPRSLGQAGSEPTDWTPTSSNMKVHPTGLVAGDVVLVRAATNDLDSYIKVTGTDLTLEDGVSSGTAFRIATPHPAHAAAEMTLQNPMCLIDADGNLLHQPLHNASVVPGQCEADFSIVFQLARAPDTPGVLRPDGGTFLLKSRTSDSYVHWASDSSSVTWANSTAYKAQWELRVFDQDCVVSGWNPEAPCDAQCGNGHQPMARTVESPPGPVGKICPPLRQQVSCSVSPCPIDCQPSPWSAFGPCTASCGGGTQTRSRVVLTAAEHGGAACPVLTSTSQCNTEPCPVDCEMSEWTNVSECSQLCGGGIKLRSRLILTEGAYGGKPCGALVSATPCNEQECKVDCEVTPWVGWSACSRSCGGGQQSRTREIVTAAAIGGAPCGDLKEKRSCNDDISCPGDCVVSEWNAYSVCSASCDGGNATRTRTVVRKPQAGGVGCPVLKESVSCNSHPCDQNCELTEWTEWSECSRKCGCGIRTRERHITIQPSGGSKCGNLLEQRQCNRHACGCSYGIPRVGYTLVGELSSESQEFMTLDAAKRYCDSQEECGGVVRLTPTHYEVRSGATLQWINDTEMVAHTKTQCAGPGGVTCGLNLWLKAEDIDSVVDGGRVESWYDASGNGHEAIQETPEMMPIWDETIMLGRPGVVFDGRGQMLRGTAVTGETKTVFAVVGTLEDPDPQSAVGQSTIFVTDSDDGLGIRRTVNHTFLRLSAARSADPVEGYTDLRNAFTVITMLYEGDTASLLMKSGSPVQRCLEGQMPASGTASERYSVGSKFGSRWFYGAVGELIVYDRVLTYAEQQTVEAQLQVKWLSTVLPPIVLWLRFEDTLKLGADSSPNQVNLFFQDVDQVEGHIEGLALGLLKPMAMLQWPGDGALFDTSYTMTLWTITPLPEHGNPHTLISGQTRIMTNKEQTKIGVATTSIEGDTLLDCGFDWSTLKPGWHHLVVVADPATDLEPEATSFYVDGKFVGSSPWYMPQFDTFGNIAGGDEQWGTIDDVKFFATRLHDINIREMATVSCVVNTWGNYGPCSKKCGEGVQHRFRTISLNPMNDGAECPHLSETRKCGVPCTEHCAVSAWSPWTDCSKECGGGSQSQSRTVIAQPSNGGRLCPGLHRSRKCNTTPCPIDCKLFGWQSFGVCSRTCGGIQTRTRSIEVAGNHGGSTCPHTEEDSLCNTAPCEQPDWSFESGSLDEWQHTGNAFQYQPTRGDNPFRRGDSQKTGLVGEFWVSSYEKFRGGPGEVPGSTQGDKPKGTLLSPPFTVQSSSISFLISGGFDNNTEYVELVVDGDGVRRSTGLDCDVLRRERWNVSEYVGMQAQIRIVDDSAEEWGHIAVDDFLFDNACWVHQQQCAAHEELGLTGSFQWSGDGISSESKCLNLADQLHEYCSNGPNEPTSVESRTTGTWSLSTTQCTVTQWTRFSECSEECGGGNQTRSRSIKVMPSEGAAPCPVLTESQSCNLLPCEYSRYTTMAMAPVVHTLSSEEWNEQEYRWDNLTAEECMGKCDATEGCFGFTRNTGTDDSVPGRCFPHSEQQLETCSDEESTTSWVRTGKSHSCSSIHTFTQTGQPDELRIPKEASKCTVKLWGAGGGDGCDGGLFGGGGGAFVKGTLQVSPQEVLTLLVGQGGAAAAGVEAPQRAFGGGGGWTNDCTDCPDGIPGSRCAKTGGGGGRTAIMRGSELLAVAAGGGGAGADAGGGGGGGSDGGVSGSSGSDDGPGGTGGSDLSAGDPNGFDHTGGDAEPERAGGGGGGLFGGGGGTNGGGGGGGSSSVIGLFPASTVMQSGGSGSQNTSGTSGGMSDSDYPVSGHIGAAGGGTWAGGSFQGGDGLAVLRCQSSPVESMNDVAGGIKRTKSPGLPDEGTLGYWDGDWLLLFNYARSGRGDESLRSGVLPQSLTGFSHAFVADALPGLTEAHVVAAKFYCQSSRHDRVIHFENNKTEILAMMYNGVATTNQPEWWSDEASTVYHSDHTASLPASADSAGQLTANPFYARSEREWRTSAGLWRCDDLADGRDAGHTIHRMWVKFSNDAPIVKTAPGAAIIADEELLVAQWPLDSQWGSWARDSTGHGNRAEVFRNLTSGASPWVEGSAGLNTGGGGWASVTPSSTLRTIANGGTISSWILVADEEGYGVDAADQVIMSQQAEGGAGIAVTAHGATITATVGTEDGLVAVNAENAIDRQRPGWTFIALAFNVNGSRLFVNGSQVDHKQGAVVSPNVLKETPLLIGAGTRDGAKCCSFIGAIKNMQVFRTALSNEEIVALSAETPDDSSLEVSPLEEEQPNTQGETRVFEEALTWYAATRACKEWGGHLLKISNESSSTNWGKRISSHFWVGLSLQNTSSEGGSDNSSSWQWPDGSHAGSFSKWVGGTAPTDSAAECAAAVPYEWSAIPCHEKLPFVCERDDSRMASSWTSLNGTCGASAVLVNDQGQADMIQCVDSGEADEASCLKAGRRACGMHKGCSGFTFSQEWSLKAPARDGNTLGRVLLCGSELDLQPSAHWRTWTRRADKQRVSRLERRSNMVGESTETPTWLRVANEAPGTIDLLKQLSGYLPPEQTELVQAGNREGVCGASLGGHYNWVKFEWSEGVETYHATFIPERDIFRDETDKAIPLTHFESDHPQLSSWVKDSGGAIFCIDRGGTDTAWGLKPSSDIEDSRGCSGEAWEGRGFFYPGSAHAGGFTGVKTSSESKDGADSIGLQIFVQRSPKIDLELEGWELVRRTVEGWFQAADELVGTESYGLAGPATSKNDFSVRFVDREYDQVLLATGDLQHWVITTPRQLQRHGAVVDAAVVASSVLNRPHRINWAHRTGDPRAPIVTVTDYEPGSSTDIIYAGGRASSLSLHSLQAHNGANVFVRKFQPCVVFGWSAYGECSRQCGGVQKRTRRVSKPALAGGAGCPALEEVVPCNLPPWIEAQGCGPVPSVVLGFDEMPSCTGSCPRKVPRDFGWAAEFGEGQSLELGECINAGLCSSKDGFTVTMWLRLDVSGRAQESLVSVGDDLEIGIQTQVPTVKLGGDNFQATQSLKDAAWSHIAIRYNRHTGGVTVFVDGVGEEEFGKKMVWFDDDALVMAGLNAAGVSLFGQIDDLFIFDSPLEDAVISVQAAPPRLDIIEVDISGGFDWQMARDACAPRDMCSKKQLCDGSVPKYAGNSSWSENTWLPVSDDKNMWIQYGSGENEQPNRCKTWEELDTDEASPSWGNSRESKGFKHTALCCLGKHVDDIGASIVVER